MELPFPVVKGTDLTSLEPTRDTMEVEGVVTHSPRYRTLLTGSRSLICLTLYAWKRKGEERGEGEWGKGEGKKRVGRGRGRGREKGRKDGGKGIEKGKMVGREGSREGGVGRIGKHRYNIISK